LSLSSNPTYSDSTFIISSSFLKFRSCFGGHSFRCGSRIIQPSVAGFQAIEMLQRTDQGADIKDQYPSIALPFQKRRTRRAFVTSA
jgi:hypothetical protein